MQSKMEEEVGKLKGQLTTEQGKLHAKKKAMSNLQNSHVRHPSRAFGGLQDASLLCSMQSSHVSSLQLPQTPCRTALGLVRYLFSHLRPAIATLSTRLAAAAMPLQREPAAVMPTPLAVAPMHVQCS